MARKKTGKLVNCCNCHKEIYKSPNAMKTHKKHFCSKKCQYEFSKTLIGENAVAYKNKLRYYICKYCHKEFSSYIDNRVYCSYGCESNGYKVQQISLTCDNCNKTYDILPSSVKWHNIREYKKNFCCKNCSYEYYSGKNHPFCIDDRSKLKDSNKTIRWGKDMNRWRKAIFERDGYCCQICHDYSRKGHSVEINAHHIKSFVDYPEERFNIENGITLCNSCHIWIHHLNILSFQ